MSGAVASRVRRTALLGSCALSLFAAACGNAPSTTASDDANVALLRRVIDEGWTAKKYEVLPELYAADYVSTTNGVRDSIPGPAGVEAGMKGIATQSPDYTVTIDDIFSAGDRVVMRWTFKATDVPTGKPIQVAGTTVSRIANGKVAEAWANYDLLAMTLSTGATITPPAAPAAK
jgi:hypothetical protein